MNDTMSKYDFTKIPFEKIVELGHIPMLRNNIFCVSWLLGRYCNYNCSYCWPYARSDVKDHRPLIVITDTLDEIKRQARQNNFNAFSFSFSGGEPTLHPDFLDIIKHYVDDTKNTEYQALHMTTNLSRGLRWFESFIKICYPLNRFSITGSWHKEFAKKEQFSEKCLMLIDNDVQVTINMVMVPQWFDALWDEALYFHDQGINVTLKPQSDPTASFIVSDYTDEMIEKMRNGFPQRNYTQGKRKNYNINLDETNQHYEIEMIDEDGNIWYVDQAERFNSFDFNKFKGWNCNAGFQSVIIREPDGSIKRGYSCCDEPLGNIETGFKLFDKPMPCITNSCVSSADSKIPKKKQCS